MYFSKSIFLQIYQAERPLIPFLASDLEKLLRDVMSRYLKTDLMTSANSYLKLVKVDPESQENTVSSSQIDVGIVTKRELNKLKEQKTISQKQKLEFEINCKAFLTRTTEKLLEKSPLKFPVVRHLRCLNPQIMAGPLEFSAKLFERLLGCLIDAKRVREVDADLLKKEYSSFITEVVHSNAATLLLFQKYDKVKDERIDLFLAAYLKESPYKKLWELVKCLLVLSHGQAGVERGVSVNSEIMAYNFKERSVVALRVTYDHIQRSGGVLNVKIDQELRNAVKSASSQYRAELKKQEEEKQMKNNEENKSINKEIASLKGKRKRLLEDSSTLQSSVEKLMDLAEKEQKMIHVTKANSYRRTIQSMEKEAEDLFNKVEQLKKKLKK